MLCALWLSKTGMKDAPSSNFSMEGQKFWSCTLGNTAWSCLMSSNPNGGQTRKLWVFFGLFTTVILNWLWPTNSKHHSMLSPAFHPHPSPLTWTPPTVFWLVSLLLTSSGSNQPPHTSLKHKTDYTTSYWKTFNSILLPTQNSTYVLAFHDMEPRTLVSTLLFTLSLWSSPYFLSKYILR